MAPHRIGGLAVALGIGSAVVAGHGVASAQPSDGSTNSSSTGSSTSKGSDASAPSAPSTDKGPATESASGKSAPESENVNAETESTTATDDSSADSDQTDGASTKKKGSKGSRATSVANDPVVRSARTAVVADVRSVLHDVSPPPTPTAEVAAESVSAVTVVDPRQQVSTPTKPQDPVEIATVALSRAVSGLLTPMTDDTPTAPLESAAMFTLAAASRRELTAPPDVDQAADPVTTSLATGDSLPAADEPAVVAVEQTAPLAWLQQVPVIGPTVVTPIVTLLHLIPIVSDVLHPLIGYPVQMGLPAGAPVSRDVKVISSDGTAIYVHFMPASGLLANQKAPTVLDGPGLTLPGATNIDGNILDDILIDATGLMSVGTLRQAGYNVVTWDPRGEWNSGGQLELNSAEFEGKDMSAIISWIATQPEVRLDAPGDPRLGMVGVSYGGAIQLVTAANDTRVDAIVPAITYNRLDSSLYKGQAFKSSWATPLVAALALTGARINPRIVPAVLYGDLTGMMSESDVDLLKVRNPDIEKITVPTLLIQGTADTIFSVQEADNTAQTLLAHGVPTKVLWFCGGHGFCANNPIDLRDGAVIKLRTLEWLDRYVKGSSADTGPQFEWVDQHGQWFSSKSYPVSPGSSIVASTSDRTLPLIPYLGGSGIPLIPFAFEAPIALALEVPPATSTTYLIGAPKLTLTYSGTGTSDHVYAQLVDNATGLVLSFLAAPIPVTLDGDSHTLTVPLEPVAHTLRPGESVTLQLVGSAGLYERITPSLGDLKVSSMQLTLPTAKPTKVSSP